MKRVGAVSGATDEEFSALEDKARELEPQQFTRRGWLGFLSEEQMGCLI